MQSASYHDPPHLEALIEGVIMAPFDSWYTQVGINLTLVQVCATNLRMAEKMVQVCHTKLISGLHLPFV